MPLLEHLIVELQKLTSGDKTVRLKGEDYDDIVSTVEEAASSSDDEGE